MPKYMSVKACDQHNGLRVTSKNVFERRFARWGQSLAVARFPIHHVAPLFWAHNRHLPFGDRRNNCVASGIREFQ